MTELTDLLVKETPKLSGTVRAPSSKAHTHRAFVAATLSAGRSKITRPLLCDDTWATIDACVKLGAKVDQTGKETLEVQGRAKPLTPRDVIDCRESGATMRFLTPVCALADGKSTLTGRESLSKRPMEPMLDALKQLGVKCLSAHGDGCPPLVVFGGGIEGGAASIRGDVSSQFISGLLFATPLARRDTDILLTTPLESKPYVAVTLDVLREHGVEAEVQTDYNKFHVPSGQAYSPSDHIVEGDYSSAAFLLAAGAVTDSHLRVENLFRESLQGDRLIVELLRKMGAEVKAEGDFVEVQGTGERPKPVEADLRDNPDLVPICVALACSASGKSKISGVKRLRFKESDRMTALVSELTKMGGRVRAADDILEVEGQKRLHGAKLDPRGDHRIAMACTVASLKADGPTLVQDIECINKSYPDFVRDMISLGGRLAEQ